MRCLVASSSWMCAGLRSSYGYPHRDFHAARYTGFSGRVMVLGTVGSSGSHGRASNSLSVSPGATRRGGWEWLSIALILWISATSAGSGVCAEAGIAAANSKAVAITHFMVSASLGFQRVQHFSREFARGQPRERCTTMENSAGFDSIAQSEFCGKRVRITGVFGKRKREMIRASPGGGDRGRPENVKTYLNIDSS